MAADGSGTVNLTLNLSASKTKVASLMLLDSVNGYKVPSKQQIQKEMEEAVAYLRKSHGISNVKKTMDFENYIATVSFAFKNVSNINHVNQNVLKKLKIRAINNSSYSFSPETGIFQRKYLPAKEALVEYNKLKPEVKNVFKEASYTSIYRFERPVAVNTNPLSKISKTKKAVMLNAGIMGLINGKTNISNQITLAK
ncbi:hypothetical protein [Pedobacter sp. N36a]|uniref:hypothetical protein n=1 Tax=Pedobacter sp. N36a TaxID=2767996 RepID=UPI0021028475|nr:hypothetical protein [Pedobacter sp. N36a]